MTHKKQYKIDLWLFIGSVIVMLYILIVNLMFWNNDGEGSLKEMLEWITIPVFILGTFIPLIVVFRSIVNKTESKGLALLSILFSLITAILIGYSSMAE